MSSTNKTTYYELSQYVGTDKPTYLSDYNGDMLKIDSGIHDAATDASTALTTANSAASAATTALTNASAAVTTANTASATALEAKTTAETASTNASAALTAAEAAETAAEANTIENLAPAYDNTLTYQVGDLCTFVDAQNSGKLYKCIVPVNTPMDFNINYWDDVTTSEIYAAKSTVLKTETSDGSKTHKQMIEEILSPTIIAMIKDDFLKYDYEIVASNGTIFRLTNASVSAGDVHFTAHDTYVQNNSGNIYLTTGGCGIRTVSDQTEGYICDINTNGGTGGSGQTITFNFTNYSTSIASNGFSYRLIKSLR